MHESHIEILKELDRQFNELLPTINENIEKYRKGSFTIKVLDKNGVGVKVPFKLRQVSHDFDFGTNALMLGAMGDKEQLYRDSITNLFNLVTTTFCWNLTEPNPNEFRFEEGSKEIYRRPPPDRVLKFCEENNLRAKGQPLFCGRWNPDWVPQDFDKFKNLWINFIKNVAKRYDGKFNVFDVVNESYEVDTSWKNMEWIPTSYNEFVKWLLKTAGNVFSNTCIMERNEATKVNFGEYANRYYNDNKEKFQHLSLNIT
jgi:GH35 family endo-1,4-beta-xylanase